MKSSHAGLSIVGCVAGLAWGPMAMAEGDGASAGAEPEWGIEVKRQNTDRATASESTKTTVRIERYWDGPVTLFRLDLPFPDDKTSFEGDPFNPRPGDAKIRVGLASLPIEAHPWSPFFELTFPTANPESLGSGKYQFSAGIKTTFPLGVRWGEGHRWSWGMLAQQVVSFAGDEAAKDVNYSKFELSLRDQWPRPFTLKATLKPVVDWVKDGKTGAVTEIEGEWKFAGHWEFTLMGGTRTWGPAVASTYGKRIEITLRREF